MKHASPDALTELARLLEQLRAIPRLKERKPGCFYRGSAAFLHFHEDAAGLFADAKLSDGDFERLPVDTPAQRQALLDAVRTALTSPGASGR